jgi:hypothetical protein
LCFAFAGLLLSGAAVSSPAVAAGGISCPSDSPAVRGREEPNTGAGRASLDADRRAAAPIDGVRPARTELATFALG